jgi:hypothetical protein
MSLDRTLPARHRSFQPDGAEGSKSAAWLAAEHVFVERQQALPAATAAVVTLKRRRAMARPADAAGPAAEAAPALSTEALEPRVFRLHSARSEPPEQPAAPNSTPLAPTRKRRLAASERRPGPVAHIVVEPRAVQATPVLSTRLLAERLAEVEPILDAIRVARSFRFIDERPDAAWHRLSRAADRLLEQITRPR